MIATLRGTIISAWLDLRSQPIRTLAAIGGMIAAIAAVIVMASAHLLSSQANAEYLAWQYGRPMNLAIFAMADPAIPRARASAPPSAPSGPTDRRTTADLDLVPTLAGSELVALTAAARATLQENGIAQVSVLQDARLGILTDTGLSDVNVTIVSPEYADIQVIRMTAGDFPDRTAGGPAIRLVVNQRFLTQFGIPPERAVGTVLNYVDDAHRSSRPFPERFSRTQQLVIAGVGEWSGNSTPSNALVVSSVPRGNLMPTGAIRLVAHIRPEDRPVADALFRSWAASLPGYRLRDIRVAPSALYDQMQPILSQQRITAIAVSAVALGIGGLGILGIGLAGVRERSRELGLRRAIGASTPRVFVAMIVQTLMELVLAIVIALPLAWVIIVSFARQLVLAQLPMPAVTGVPWQAAGIGVGAALAVGVLAGLLPAWRAARTSISQALRD